MIAQALQYRVLYFIESMSTLTEKKSTIKEFSLPDTSTYVTKTLQLSFIFCFSMPRKKVQLTIFLKNTWEMCTSVCI